MILPKIDLNEVYKYCDKEAQLKTECSDTSDCSPLEKYKTAEAQRINDKIQKIPLLTGKVLAKYKLACLRFCQSRKSNNLYKLQSLRNKLTCLKHTIDVQDKLLQQYDREKEMLVKQISLLKMSDI